MIRREHSRTAYEGAQKAISRTPQFSAIGYEFRKLNTREARVAFVDAFFKQCAANFEHLWPVIYEALEWVETEKLYADPRVVNSSEVYPDFKSYFEARLKQPFSIWFDLERTHQYVQKYAPELLTTTFTKALAAANKAQEADEEDKQNQRPAGGDGSNQYKQATVYNNEKDVNDSRPTGNSVKAALRRLRKDRPDIHARVLNGSLSANAGMIEAGFRKKRLSRKRTALDRLRIIWEKASPEERETFRAEINN